MQVLLTHKWFKNNTELDIIKKYQMTNDRSILTDALRNIKKPSQVMLDSIALIFEGKEIIPHYRKVTRRKNEFMRNFEIAIKVGRYSKETGRLKRDTAENSPILKVANEMYLSYDVVSKCYYSFSSIIKRLESNTQEGIDKLIEKMMKDAFNDFDDVCLPILQNYLNGESPTVTPSKDDQCMAADREE